VAAAITLAGFAALPAALLASTDAAAATSQATTTTQGATTEGGSSPAAVAITGMNPRWAGPRSAITISGLLTNTSKTPVSGLVVQLYASPTQVGSIAEITPGTVPYTDLANVGQLPGAQWRSGRLQPGQSVRWRIHFRAREIGMTMFGVYPLAAVAENRAGVVLGASTSYLPFMPGKKSPYSRPKPERISWLWPLIDKPMLGAPWQNVCKTPQAKALARSLSPGGRLANLVAVGQRGAAATAAWQAAELAGQSARSKAGRTEPSQSLAGLDGITWAVDPALLANAKALTTCRSTAPGLAQAATAWLASVGTATANQPLFVLPYGDPNVVALIRQNHQDDAKNAYQGGRDVATRILGRDVSPSASHPPDLSAQTAAIAWPAGGTAGYATIENLASSQVRVRTVVLSRSALPQAPSTVVQTPDGAGHLSTLLLANDSLGALLSSVGNAHGAAFATSQAFLAQTALLAAQQPGQPIVVAPSARWNPSASLATGLLAETAPAPWLSPVTLTALASGTSAPLVSPPQDSLREPSYPKWELGGLKMVGQQIYQLERMQAIPNTNLYLALGAIESSAWDGRSRPTARAMLHTVEVQVASQQGAVHIVAAKAGIRITLGGLKGSVPVSIDNPLGFAVRVRLRLNYNQATGVKIVADPAVVTISKNSSQTIKLHVQATQVGSTTLTMRLENSQGQLLPSSGAARMTVHATQVGVLGVIIFACALGVVLIASAARAVRHGRPVTAAASTPRDGAKPDGMGSEQLGSKVADGERAPSDALEEGEIAGEPATVVSERSELGTPRPPGL
jgi:Family of unknown function (DUF6049)